MANHPPNIGSSPVDIVGFHAVNCVHGPIKRDRVATIVTHHSFGQTGGPRSIKNVKRIGCVDGYTICRLCVRHRFLPINVSTGLQFGNLLRPLYNDRL